MSNEVGQIVARLRFNSSLYIYKEIYENGK